MATQPFPYFGISYQLPNSLNQRCPIHSPLRNYFSRSANLPTGLYILPSLISSSFFCQPNYLSIYSTDFHYFLPNEKYLREFY